MAPRRTDGLYRAPPSVREVLSTWFRLGFRTGNGGKDSHQGNRKRTTRVSGTVGGTEEGEGFGV